jgi:CelD/BcsL family acetyltransferase involved in cellulose biosynthesis
MRRLRLATSAAELAALRPLWESLEPAATLFQSYAWNSVAARVFAGREEPHVIALESDAGAVIVPAARTADGVTFLGEMLFDYRDVLAAGDPALLPEALGELARAGRPLDLPAVREASRICGHGELTPWVGAPYLASAGTTPDDYLSDHFKARRQLHRLENLGAEFHCYDGSVGPLLEWLYRRKAEQFAASALDIFSDPARRRCMVEVAAASGARCEVFTIELGSRIIAALVSFRDPGVRRFYTVWHELAWERYSPGVTIMFRTAHLSLAAGLDVDFLTGEQPHKTRLANGRVQLYRLHAPVARLAGRDASLPVAA